jgi:hypothetical protein
MVQMHDGLQKSFLDRSIYSAIKMANSRNLTPQYHSVTTTNTYPLIREKQRYVGVEKYKQISTLRACPSSGS